jgi:hypothetical protein
VHLVGFIINKFVTMHGHMNVKLKHLSVVGTSVTSAVLQRARHRIYGSTRLFSPKVSDRLRNQMSVLFSG